MPADARTAVDFELANDHVLVDTMLNGTGPYRFVLDSGSPFGLLDTEVARELALAVRAHGTVGGVGDHEAQAGETTVRVVRIGEATLTEARFVVTPLRATIGMAEGRSIDGVVGRELFERYVTTVDYARRKIVFGGDVAALGRSGAALVAMRVNGGIAQIACRIATIPTACNIDTGSRLAITLPAPFVAASPDRFRGPRSAIGIDGYGLGGPALGRLGYLASVSFATFTLHDVVCDFSTQQRGAFASKALGGNIGGGILRRFAVTFNYAHRQIAFEPGADFERPEFVDRSGLFLVADGGTVRVLDVRPGTPAARAEMARGDRILELDGRNVVPNDLPAIRARLMAASERTVTVRLERAGTGRDIVFELADYVPR